MKALSWKHSNVFSVLLRNICRCQHYGTRVALHVKCRIFLSDFKQIGVSRHIFVKVPNVKFHENPSNWSRADTC